MTQTSRAVMEHSPLKFPLIAYGMMPSGHTRSGLEVAALLRRRSLSTDLLLLTLSSEEVDLLAATMCTPCPEARGISPASSQGRRWHGLNDLQSPGNCFREEERCVLEVSEVTSEKGTPTSWRPLITKLTV
ncbi:hypothetical protein INR49_015232 [Caranx melampygus]|nr:hypothetical protein INR49_015232 [Caranx melampygus]